MPNDPVTKCLFKRCGKPITQVKIGRLKEYCSPTCRQGAFRERHGLHNKEELAEIRRICRDEVDRVVREYFAEKAAS